MTFELKNEDGTLKSLNELEDEVKEMLIDELDCMDEDAALELGNKIREGNNDDLLFKNEEDDINEQLEDLEPWEIIQLDYDSYADYFYMEYGEPEFTNDVWYGLDTEEIADDILAGEWYDELTWDLREIVDEYKRAKEKLKNINPIQREASWLLARYTNCEADTTELLQFIDRLVRNEEGWKEIYEYAEKDI